MSASASVSLTADGLLAAKSTKPIRNSNTFQRSAIGVSGPYRVLYVRATNSLEIPIDDWFVRLSAGGVTR